MNKKRIIGEVILLVLIVSIMPIIGNIGLYIDNTSDPIFIDGTGSQDWVWAERQPWCSKINDVYYIENLIISGRNARSCIEIRNSNVIFIINNCIVYDSSSSINEAGIKLYNVNNAQLINNNCSYNNRAGISLQNNCYNNIISNNIVCNTVSSGIHLDDCDYNTISNNNVNNNGYGGIYFNSNCNSNTISNNTVNDNFRGIWLNKYDNNIISQNSMRDNGHVGMILTNCNFFMFNESPLSQVEVFLITILAK